MNDPYRDDGFLPPPGPRVLARAEHGLSRSMVSPNALKVLYRLHHAGFLAFLVGGAVRDLLLGRRPKDFDVGTNARPQQVRQLFRNARVIGRRFRLVMITFAEEIVEVATFRCSPEPPDMEDGDTADALAPAVEVEEFGTPEEDARRRDFTVNGLFYNIADFTIIDHVGGLGDLDRRIIRSIGPARQRFGEDPVRMMRAIEYSARLGFALDDEAAGAIAELRGEIRRAAPARIAYELGESLCGGQSEPIFRGLDETGLLELIGPEMALAARASGPVRLWPLLAAGDAAVQAGERPPEDALLGVLLLPLFVPALERALASGVAGGEAERAARDLWAEVARRLCFSHYRTHVLRSAYYLVARMLLSPRSAKQVVRIVRHEAFGVASWLARLLAATSEPFRPALERWRVAAARVAEGLSPLPEAGEAPARPARHRRRRRRRRPGAAREGS
ncbi:MAG TPA: CCA tRNA nucleotidyltransferase [Thermoanaerobaculaceae bacterium]|nr:CCA tRNA nucleotidyltransferase [Thermoanaerobaculaceae bacterium]HRS15390.1 CCA tRNA nucleotidyltransferase [Thermoanaerobaculaceae bacterium]